MAASRQNGPGSRKPGPSVRRPPGDACLKRIVPQKGPSLALQACVLPAPPVRYSAAIDTQTQQVESRGQTIICKGRTFKTYRGMGSLGAMVTGSSERYRQGEATEAKLVPEGVEGRVPYKGNLAPFVYQLVGGLRAGMGYCGCRTIEDLRTQTRFIQVTAASVQESHPHDIAITQEAPNYSTADASAADAG